MMKKISLEDWNKEWDSVDDKESVPLCELPFSVNEIERLFNIQLLTHSCEGLGDCYGDPVEIDGLLYWMQGYMDKDCKDPAVHLLVKRTKTPLKTYLDTACKFFGVKAKELRYVAEQIIKET